MADASIDLDDHVVGWKAIAAFVGMTEWQAMQAACKLDMPVYEKTPCRYYARKSELVAWERARPRAKTSPR